MIHRTVFHNGRLLPVEDVRLSPGQAGLLSGWGLFTTIRIIEGLPFAFERHWQRLARDAERTHCPFPFEEETVRAQLGEVLRANDVREGCARIYAIYNQFGLWRSDETLSSSRPRDVFSRPSRPSGSGASRTARARPPRRLAASGRESNFLAQ